MFIIGELINGMYKNVRDALGKKDKKVIQDLARAQCDAGASALDINCGPASRNPEEDMQWRVGVVREAGNTTLCLDSTKADVIEAGLSIAKNKTVINSTSADKEKLEILVPLAKKHNSLLIGLSMNKKGLPQNKLQRLELAADIITYCQEANFPASNLYLDPIVLPVNVAQAQSREVIDTIREFKLLSDPAPKTIVGLSNISQGTLQRSLINRTFLVMAQEAGLDSAILDPLDKELMDALITAELILNKQIYCDSFLEAYRKK